MVVGGLYEVTMTRDNSGLVSFYVNGVLKGTVAAITSMTTTASTTDFGFNVTGGGSDTAGNFLRWATWKNRTLTATEVMALANAPFAMLRPVVRRSYFVAAAAAPPPTGGPMLIPFGSRDLKGLATAAVVGTVLANPTLRRRQLLGGGDD